MKIKLLIIATGIIVLILIVLTVLFSNNGGGKPAQEEGTPAPTTSSEAKGEAGVGFVVGPASQEQEQKSFMVGNLISKLPTKDSAFAMYYSFTTNKFTVYLDPNRKDLADSQFEAFLKENGVEKSWIENLVTENKNITPAP